MSSPIKKSKGRFSHQEFYALVKVLSPPGSTLNQTLVFNQVRDGLNVLLALNYL